MKPRDVIVVLGAHRSGTSAITRGLATLGVTLGDNMIPPSARQNPKGFWEDAQINALCIELLNHLGSGWEHLALIDTISLQDQLRSDIFDRAVELIRRKTEGVAVFGFKDPRLPRLLGFWKPVFEHCNVQASYVLALRHPTSVARSLQARDGFPLEHGYLLWAGHLLASIVGTTGNRRIVVDYDRLMLNPHWQLARIAERFGLDENRSEIEAFSNSFLDINLRHTSFGFDDLINDSTCPPMIRGIYAAMMDVADDHCDLDDSSFLEHFDSFSRDFCFLERSGLLSLSDCLIGERTALKRKLSERDSLIGAQDSVIAARDEELAGLRDHLSILNRESEDRKRQVELLTRFLAKRHGQLAEIAAFNAQLRSDHSAAVGQLDESRAQVTALHEIAERLQRDLGDMDRIAAEAELEVGSLKSEVGSLQAEVGSLKSEVGSLAQALQQRDAQVVDLEKHIAERDVLIRSIFATVSWRVTAPLRTIRRLQFARPFRSIERRSTTALTPPEHSSYLEVRQLHDGAPNDLENCRKPSGSGVTCNDGSDYREWVRQFDTPTDERRRQLTENAKTLSIRPLISIVMPVFNSDSAWLRQAIESVRSQIYTNWELCIADDASTLPSVAAMLSKYRRADPRIKVVFRESNGHISAASNSALDLCAGDWVALLDHDDLLSEDALFWVVEAINRNPNASVLYSDEDKLDSCGERVDPHFKSDWNYELFLTYNMVSHLGVYRSSLIQQLGGFRPGYEGAQDYDLALRCIEHVKRADIVHIPRVLYHWRLHSTSTASATDSKPYALPAGKRAIEDHLTRTGQMGRVEALPHGYYRVRFDLPANLPLVSIVIPTRDSLDLIRNCLDSILTRTTYSPIEIIVVDNGSDDPEAVQFLKSVQADARVRVLHDGRPFNYSALNNLAVKAARGEFVAFVNNDVEVLSADWLEEMVSHAIRPEVGAVGARLWYPDDSIQHAGVIVGLLTVAGHPHRKLPKGHLGYFARSAVTQELSAVTAACLLIKKSIFVEVGGFDETNLPVAFNDVDLCLRIRHAGYRNIYAAYAEMYHQESATRGRDDVPEKRDRFEGEVRYMQDRWKELIQRDPAYNPNLTLDYEDFSLAWPPRHGPLRAVLEVVGVGALEKEQPEACRSAIAS